MTPAPLTDQLAEAKRELVQRERFYPRWVGEGKLAQATADHRLHCMRSTVALLEAMVEADRKRNEPELFDGQGN